MTIEARRLGAAPRDPEQQSHPERLDGALVEDLDLEAGVRRECGGAVGEDAGRQDVARFVGQRARVVGRQAEDASAGDRAASSSDADVTCTATAASGPASRSPVL